MSPKVLVVNAVEEEVEGLREILRPAGYTPWIIHHLEEVEQAVKASDCLAMLLDLDSLAVSNRTIREMTLKFPHVCFLCTSWKPFHPELQDAICYHIYACIQKPIDSGELLYWLKCIHQDEKMIHKPVKKP